MFSSEAWSSAFSAGTSRAGCCVGCFMSNDKDGRVHTIPIDKLTQEAYGPYVKERMGEAGISARKLAAACEPPADKGLMSRWLSGKNQIWASTVHKIEQALARLSK